MLMNFFFFYFGMHFNYFPKLVDYHFLEMYFTVLQNGIVDLLKMCQSDVNL